MGHTNMTIETIADMVWGLDHAIKIDIFDPCAVHGLNHWMHFDQSMVQAPSQSTGMVTGSPKNSSVASIVDELIRKSTTPAPVGLP
jgi:hypothetical protein